LGGRIIGKGLAAEIVNTWLNTPFEGGRHQRRLDKINQINTSPKENH
ncbi:MAG TPA: ribose-5-phosphate isomerase, partial [Methylococcales bacterium]|nr:ribose-5-phosphate isomerase [Methylococcales bacterium]